MNKAVITAVAGAVIFNLPLFCGEFENKQFNIAIHDYKSTSKTKMTLSKEETVMLGSFIDYMKDKKSSFSSNFIETEFFDILVGNWYRLSSNQSLRLTNILDLFILEENRWNISKGSRSATISHSQAKYIINFSKYNSRRRKTGSGDLISRKAWLVKIFNEADHSTQDYIYIDKTENTHLVVRRTEPVNVPIDISEAEEREFSEALWRKYPPTSLTPYISCQDVNDFCNDLANKLKDPSPVSSEDESIMQKIFSCDEAP